MMWTCQIVANDTLRGGMTVACVQYIDVYVWRYFSSSDVVMSTVL